MKNKNRLSEYKSMMLVLQMGSAAVVPALTAIVVAFLLKNYYPSAPEWLTPLLIIWGVFGGVWSVWQILLRLLKADTPKARSKADRVNGKNNEE